MCGCTRECKPTGIVPACWLADVVLYGRALGCVRVHVCVCVRVYVHAYVHTYVRACVCVCMRAYVWTYARALVHQAVPSRHNTLLKLTEILRHQT